MDTGGPTPTCPAAILGIDNRFDLFTVSQFYETPTWWKPPKYCVCLTTWNTRNTVYSSQQLCGKMSCVLTPPTHTHHTHTRRRRAPLPAVVAEQHRARRERLPRGPGQCDFFPKTNSQNFPKFLGKKVFSSLQKPNFLACRVS